MNFLLILAILIGADQAFAEEPTTADFSTGIYLDLDGTGPLYSVELPLEVYRTVRRPDLGDVRVFNEAGEAVPHGFRTVAGTSEALRQNQEIPFFPLYDTATALGPADLAMRVTRNTAGTIVNIEAGGRQEPGEPQVTGYLLDLSGIKWMLGELAFEWRAGQDTSIINVRLQHSNDLQHWNPLVAAATLADLQHGGQRVEKKKISLPHRPQNYLLLTWQSSGQPLRFTQIIGHSQTMQSLQPRQWADLENGVVRVMERELAVLYSTTLRLPASSAQVVFHDKNSLARVALQSRASDKERWTTRCEQVFYSLSFAASEVQNEPCVFAPTADSLWRALVREDGAGIAGRSRIPVLQLGWVPSELLFLARGAPPFVLAFGSAKLQDQEKKEAGQMLMQAVDNAKDAVGQARLGKRIELGGEKALQPLPAPLPWKKWMLWAILLIGVGLLAAMARSLIREMHKREEKPATKEG